MTADEWSDNIEVAAPSIEEFLQKIGSYIAALVGICRYIPVKDKQALNGGVVNRQS